MKPFIGITCNYDTKDTVGEVTQMGIPGQDWDYVAGDYIYAIEKAGGIPVLLPRTEDPADLEPLIDRLDGILVSGGHDVNPALYHARITGKCGRIIPERDTMDLAVASYSYQHKKPLLGICRGIQILNVMSGGTINQDVIGDSRFNHSVIDMLPRNLPSHKAEILEGSLLYQIFGKKEVAVNSFHHQAVEDVGPKTTVIARSDDGVTEGIFIEGGNPFTMGVQWHPEMMYTDDEQQKIFRAFVDACRK